MAIKPLTGVSLFSSLDLEAWTWRSGLPLSTCPHRGGIQGQRVGFRGSQDMAWVLSLDFGLGVS